MLKKAKDYLNFLSKLTVNRAINALLLVVGYLISKYNRKPYNIAMPVALAFEPTTSCNLRCPECPSGLRSFTRPTGMLSKGQFQKLINELADTLLYLTFYFQGEPYLHPDFLEMVSYASKKKIYTSTSTNAHYLNPEMARKTVLSGIDRVIISIDGTTQETYQQYRIGGSLNKVLEGTRNLVMAKKELKSATPHIIFQFLVVKPNEHQIADVKKMTLEYGVDELRLKTAQIYDYQNGSSLIPSIDKYSRYRLNNQNFYEIKSKKLDHCWKMWHSCVITWDGKVVPCCFDKDAKYVMGDTLQVSFKEVWNSDTYQNFRKSLIHSRSKIEMCKNCTEGIDIWG
jgi:radical SAM protein with 4Fe4S-binding SPASM domain